MLLTKLRNSAELFWDTLDGEEKQAVLYVVAWFVISVVASVARARREAFKHAVISDVFAELTAAAPKAREDFVRDVVAEVRSAD